MCVCSFKGCEFVKEERKCVCMYGYHITVAIKQLAPLFVRMRVARVCMCVCMIIILP